MEACTDYVDIVYNKLNKNFVKYFKKLKSYYGEEIAALNGLSDKQLDLTEFIDNFTSSDVVSDISIDGSANITRKDITALCGELSKSQKKLLCTGKIYSQITKDWSTDVAKEWFKKEWLGYLYMHDACSATLVHYCYAYDLKDLAEKGLYFIKSNAKAPKHLETFVDFVKEFINYTSNRSSGAVGLPNLIPYMYYFWKKDVADGYYPSCTSTEKFAKQHIQRFIFGVNQPYTRDGIQSALK